MERYYEGQKKSIFEFIRNRNFGKFEDFDQEKIFELQNRSHENIELKKHIKKLQKKILEENDISDIIKQIEYFLPVGNDNKTMSYLLYNTRYFIDIIECLNYSRPKHMLNLLNFTEKMIKTNINISKYVSNNKSFLKLILKLMQEKVFLDLFYFFNAYKKP